MKCNSQALPKPRIPLNKSINQLCLTRATHNSLQLINPWPSNSRSNWNLEMLIFEEGGKPENTEKNPRSKEEDQQQTQPTYDAGSGSRTRETLVGGERSHHNSSPAPHQVSSGVLCSKVAQQQQETKVNCSFFSFLYLLSSYSTKLCAPCGGSRSSVLFGNLYYKLRR